MMKPNGIQGKAICAVYPRPSKGGLKMEHATLTAATWFWLLVPQLLVVALSLINFFVQRRNPS